MIGSLFSGILGLDLGLLAAGLGPVAWCAERDPFCRRVIRHRAPGVQLFGSVQEVSRATARPVRVLCGGAPCQPVSVAGHGLGATDERWLWPECFRIARELQPEWCVWENVPMLRQRGLCGLLRDIAALGLNAEWVDLRASDVGAPHRRERIFIVTHRDGATLDRFRAALERAMAERGIGVGQANAGSGRVQRKRGASNVAGAAAEAREQGGGRDTSEPASCGGGEALADGDGDRREQQRAARLHADRALGHNALGRGPYPPRPGDAEGWSRWDGPQPLIRGSADELPDWVDRLAALGNAVVPGQAEMIGRAIMEARA